jgi:TonB family protein
MSLLLGGAIKAGIILLTALGIGLLLRRRSAAVRHWMLASAVGAALLVPALALLVPAWQLPMLGAADRPVTAGVLVGIDAVTPMGPVQPVPDARRLQAATTPLRVMSAAVAVWLGGAGLMFAVLLAGLVQLAAIARAARRADGACRALADEIAREHGLLRPVRLLFGRLPTPVTWGVFRPAIVLPEAACAWSDERLRIVLQHEFAHVRRGDWATHLSAQLLRALYWFNPLAWIAARRLRLESEHACDDAVLSAGVSGAAYAGHLLDLARAAAAGRASWSPALPVARPSGLERRVRVMLNAHVDRHPLTRRARLVTMLAFVAVAVPLAGAGMLAQGPFATVAGTIADQSGAPLAKATLTVTHRGTQSRNEVRSDGSGRYEFVGLPPGDYLLEADVAGFKHFGVALALNGQQVDRDVVMDVGSLTEVITVADSDDPPRGISPETMARVERIRAERAAKSCTATAGGTIRPPVKLRDVRPEYPAALKAAKVGGTVDIEARIGTDGTVRELRADAAANPDLAAAAVNAVRDWRFDETLLNCTPVEVSMTVHVTFTPRP